MTRKDYEMIASCIGHALAQSRNCKHTIHDVATHLALELKFHNEKFDSGKFFTRIEFHRKSHEVQS